jgi:hypothetical protein
MAQLRYDISVGNTNQMRAVLRGVEREVASSNKRMAAGSKATTQQIARESAKAASAPMGRMYGPTAKDYVAQERQRTRERIVNQKREERLRIDGERRISRASEQLDRQRSAALMSQHRERERASQRADRAAQRSEITRRETSRTMRRGVVRGVTGAVGGVARVVGAGTAIAGGFLAADAIREDMAIRRGASQLANQAGTPELKGQLTQEARGVRGFTGEQVLGGMSEFVTKTGDLDTARKIIGPLGELSLATGADIGDLGATAGQAFNVLKDQISDPVERVKQLNALMGVLAQQGAMGAVEIRDLAQDFGKLGAATRGFEGSAPDLLRTMGAFAQVAVARGGAESSADASTAASRLVNDMVMHKEKFQGLGINIKSAKDPTKLRNPMEIMADVLQKTGGDVEKTSGLFGLESAKIFKGFAATFSEAEKKRPGSGRAAVMGEFQRFAGAELDPAEITKRAESRLADPDLQFAESSKAFNAAVSKDLMPALTKLIPELVKLTPLFSGLVGILTKIMKLFPGMGEAPVVAKPGEPGYVAPEEETYSQKRFREMASGESGLKSALMGPVDAVMASGEHISSMWKHGTFNPFNQAVQDDLSGKGKRPAAPGMAPIPLAPAPVGTVSANGAPAPVSPGGATGGAAVVNQTEAAAALKDAAGALKDAAKAQSAAAANTPPAAARSLPVSDAKRGG